MRLGELPIGQIAKIQEIQHSDFKEKLEEMGCVPGAFVKTLLKAPLGDPIAYELDGYTLSMRKSEANTIIVQVVKQSQPESL